MSPNDTLFLESTYQPETTEIGQMSSIVDFQIWDFPVYFNYIDISTYRKGKLMQLLSCRGKVNCLTRNSTTYLANQMERWFL